MYNVICITSIIIIIIYYYSIIIIIIKANKQQKQHKTQLKQKRLFHQLHAKQIKKST